MADIGAVSPTSLRRRRPQNRSGVGRCSLSVAPSTRSMITVLLSSTEKLCGAALSHRVKSPSPRRASWPQCWNTLPRSAGDDMPAGAADIGAVGGHAHELDRPEPAKAEPRGEAVPVLGRELDAV